MAQADVIDRIAAVVGSVPITSSQIDQQLRLEAFFNESPVDLGQLSRTAALNRLIDQRLIEPEIRLAGFYRQSTPDIFGLKFDLDLIDE